MSKSGKSKKNKKPKSFGQKIFGWANRNSSKQKQNSKRQGAKVVRVHVKSPPLKLKDSYTIDEVTEHNLSLIRSINDITKRNTLVTMKLRLCSVTFDFTQILDDAKTNNNTQQQPPTPISNGNTKANGNDKKNDKKNNKNQNKKQNIDGFDANMLKNANINHHIFTTEELERKEKLTIGIDKKRSMLVEIVEFISTQKWWDEDILCELISCVSSNLFRTLPLGNKRKFVKGDEEEEAFLDPQWLHLQLVYELCLRFLISNDIDKKVMQKYLHGSFVLNLIGLFESEDLRERDYLKTILHRIYGRFMPLRQQIRVEIANECYRYVYGIDQHSRGVHGICEFLDIFSSIINGFSVPVKEEHCAFLRNVLIPLHKCAKYEIYFQQLADCCVLFVNKEQSIASSVLGGLLKFWPSLSPTKQAFYLREMLNVIGALVEHENGFSYPKYKDIVLLCVNKIFECMESPHFQVADQALSLWKDTVMLYLSKCQKDLIWRRLFIIFKNIELNHWNAGIKQLTTEVVLYYERIDFEYWKKLNQEYNDSNNIETNMLRPDVYHKDLETKRQNKLKERNDKWEKINEIARMNKLQLTDDCNSVVYDDNENDNDDDQKDQP